LYLEVEIKILDIKNIIIINNFYDYTY